jgi:hypothetical protein
MLPSARRRMALAIPCHTHGAPKTPPRSCPRRERRRRGQLGSLSCQLERQSVVDHIQWSVLHPHLLSLADERVPEEKARLILVVRAAAELDVVCLGSASRRVRRDVMELEEGGLAAPACASDEPAASLISPPYSTPDRRRYVTSAPGARGDVSTARSGAARAQPGSD